MKKYIISLILLVSTNSLASINYALGEWGSGGGNAIVCFKQMTIGTGETSVNIISEIKKNNNTIADDYLPYIESIEMFDLYDAKKARGLNPSKPEIVEINNGEEFFSYTNRLAKRFKDSNPHMETIIRRAQNLLPETSFVMHEYGVKYQNDLGSVVLPSEKCVISTMAAQVNSNDYYEAHIDKRLFFHPKHSKQSQATLVLHELIYAYARSFGQKDSSSTRSLVRFYLTYHKTINEKSTMKALNSLRFNNYENTDGTDIQTKEYLLYRNSRISKFLANAYENILGTIINEMFMFANPYPTTNNSSLRDLYSEIKTKYLSLRCPVTQDCLEESENMIDTAFLMKNALKVSVASSLILRWENMMESELKAVKAYVEYVLKMEYKWHKDMIKKETNITTEDFNLLESNFNFIRDEYIHNLYQFDGNIESKSKLLSNISNARTGIFSLLPYRAVVIENGVTRILEPLKLNNIIPKQ